MRRGKRPSKITARLVVHAGIAQVLRFAAEDDLAAGRLVEILPDLAMPEVPMHVVHAFGRQLPVRARLFIDFLVERMEAIGR